MTTRTMKNWSESCHWSRLNIFCVANNTGIFYFKKPKKQQFTQTRHNLLRLSEKSHNIIIDMSSATYINSGGLRCLLTGCRISRNQGGDIVLCGLNARMTDIFEMVGLDHIFTIHTTRREARDHFGFEESP